MHNSELQKELAAEARKFEARQMKDAALARLNEWLKEFPDARLKDLPRELYASFIPARVYEVAEHPQDLKIVPLPGDGSDGPAFAVVDVGVSTPVTNVDIYANWRAAETGPNKKRGFRIVEAAPEGVDRLHGIYYSEIDSGNIGLNDKILMVLKLKNYDVSPDVLVVSNFDGETKQGIGTEFYTSHLPNIAKQLGIRYISGMNNAKNITFFAGLGRTKVKDIKHEFRQKFFPQTNDIEVGLDGPEENYTVQFLYPEDKSQYINQG